MVVIQWKDKQTKNLENMNKNNIIIKILHHHSFYPKHNLFKKYIKDLLSIK